MSDEEDPNYGRIRAWLLKQPRPEIVRVISLDGAEHEVRCGRRWADTARAICTLDPATLHALSADGDVLRAERIVETGVPEPQDDREPLTVPSILSRDPETARIITFAQLLERAHEKSNDFVRDFGKILIERIDRQDDELTRVREEARQEFRERMRVEMESMQEGEGKDELLRHFFGGAEQGRQESNGQSSNGQSNAGPKWGRGWGDA